MNWRFDPKTFKIFNEEDKCIAEVGTTCVEDWKKDPDSIKKLEYYGLLISKIPQFFKLLHDVCGNQHPYNASKLQDELKGPAFIIKDLLGIKE